MPRPARRKAAYGAQTRPGLIAYYRVSTAQQGRSGLGLEAQQAAVSAYAANVGLPIIAEYREVESGKRTDRPELAAALAACRARRATLVIAKIDRLARNARFLLDVVEGTGEAGVAFCDLPQVPPGPTGKFLLTLLAAVAELEAGLISQRTTAALVAAKARGVRLGNPKLKPGDADCARAARTAWSEQARERAADVLPYIRAARAAGAASLRQIAAALKARGIRAPAGGEEWGPSQIRNVLRYES